MKVQKFTFLADIKVLIPTFFPLVISQQYEVNGADPKKIGTKSFIIDFEIFQQMSDPSFIKNVKILLLRIGIDCIKSEMAVLTFLQWTSMIENNLFQHRG